MITFKELRRRLNEVTIEQSIYDDLEELLDLIEGTFYVYRTSNNSILAKGIPDFESAKERANKIRKSLNLKWDEVFEQLLEAIHQAETDMAVFDLPCPPELTQVVLKHFLRRTLRTMHVPSTL